MLKNYKDFLFELDLSLGDAGGEGEKKKEAPDPDKEIAKEKAKKAKKERKERNEVIDKAEAKMKEALDGTTDSFRKKFEDRIKDAIDQDDRVKYHDLVLDIQRWGIPLVKQGKGDEVESASPVVKILQGLNRDEYRG